MIDRQLGRYRVLALLGKGAFAEVYRARDEGLGREVAIKLLHAHVAGEPNAGARIAREARASAALSHPSIAVIHEVAEFDGRPSIVMELVEGRPLSEAIPPGGLPPERVARWGAQIADALAHAHERGIIHRDLKGSNIVVTADGRPKILDFGLARAERLAEAGGADFDITLTETGVLSGTPSFMAPELLRGARADARSDIWALGVLLYQMATGSLPFGGGTTAETSAAILTASPKPLPERLPAELRATIERCLAKDPARRFADAGEVRAALEAIAPERGPSARRSRAILIVLAALGVVALAWATVRWAPQRDAGAPALRQRQLTTNPDGDPVALAFLSPDGEYLAYGDVHGVFLRTIDGGDTRPLELPKEFVNAFLGTWMDWFPDGKRILLSGPTNNGKPAIWSLPIVGGAAKKVVLDGSQGAVSPDGRNIAFVRSTPAGTELWVAASDGTNPRRVLGSDSTGTLAFYSAAWAPSGRRIAYARRGVGAEGRPFVRLESSDLDGARRTMLGDSLAARLHPTTALVWMPDGRVIFALSEPDPNGADMNLWALRVDPNSGAPSGRPRQLTQLVRVSYPVPTKASRDGKQMSVLMLQYPTDIYVATIPRAGAELEDVRRLTLDNRDDDDPVWTPDSRSVLFQSDRNGTIDTFEQDLDSTQAVLVGGGPGAQYGMRASPDGAWMSYWSTAAETSPQAEQRLMRVPATGGPATEVLRTRASAGIRFAGAGEPGVLVESWGDSIALSAFDVEGGRGATLARLRLPNYYTWDLSPDGRTVALLAAPDSFPRIRLYDLVRAEMRSVRVRDRLAIRGIAWEPHGAGWYVFGASDEGFRVEYVHPDGRADQILPTLPWMRGLAVSPDGKRLAFARNTVQSNAWLIEGL